MCSYSGGSGTPHWIRKKILDFQRAKDLQQEDDLRETIENW